MVSIGEILIALLVLLFMAGLVGGVVVLVVWLTRRNKPSPPVIPPGASRGQPPLPSATCPRCGSALPADAPQGLCPRCVLGVGLATQTEATGESGPHGSKAAQPPPAPADIAGHFPQLEILECLGRGGMGVVYKARQPKLNRLVALKILAPEKGADPKFAERFLREAQTLARLSHPNIVTVHDFGEADGLYYLLMEYVDGMTLRQLLQGQKIAPEEALSIVPKICEALQFAHELGVVHRDIKPENVLLDKQGRVKIADFGIAKIVAGDHLQPAITQDQVIGTPHYMAPEQVEKPQLVDHRADIYSLGVVFYEMLTGELPLGKFQPPSKKVQVDVRLDEVVLHALEKEPERRYQHASEVKTAVEAIAAAPSAPAAAVKPAAGPPIRILRWRDAWPWNWEFIQLWLIVPMVLGGLALPICLPWWGLKALWLLAPIGVSLGFAVTYAVVGHRVRQKQAALPRSSGEIAQCLVFRRPFESPGLAVLHEDRLELTPIVGSPIVIPLADIVAVKEVKWFNGTRLWLKTGFVMDLANGQRVGVAVAEVFARRWRAKLSRGTLPEIPEDAMTTRVRTGSGKPASWVTAARWTARILGTLLLAIYGLFVLGEGLPPIGSQPEGVQLNFVAVALTLLGFVIGWKREGTAALLIASGWTLWHISEGRIGLSAFQTPLPVAALYGLCWWATQGRRTLVVLGTVATLAVALGLGQFFLPTSVFVSGVVRDAANGHGIAKAELTLAPPAVNRKGPNARADKDGRFSLYVGWYAAGKQVLIWAPGYEVLTTPLGPRPLGQRRISRDFRLEKASAAAAKAPAFGPVTERVLYSVAVQRPVKAEDLDAGRELEVPADVAKGGEDQFFHWLAADGADLLAFAHEQSWELWASPMLAGVANTLWSQPSPPELLKALASGTVGLGRASLDTKEGFVSYQVNENTVFPQTFAFQTAAGGLGLLQITGFAENPRGLKIQYKLAPPAEHSQRRFVRLVVDKAAMTFEGQPTTWEAVGPLLDQVTDRTNTVLEVAVTSDQITVQQQNEWFGKCVSLANAHGLEYASFIGIHPLGSKGTAPSAGPSTGNAGGSVTAAPAGMAQAAEAESDQDFVAHHRAELGQKALNAARDFVKEHQWTMRSEWGERQRIVLKATDQAGKHITFEEVTGANGTARFTIITEPGAELSAQGIGAAIWRRLGWISPGRGALAQAAPAPVVRAEAGTYQVTLTNGITVEVVAVTRNPLMSWLWWKPDGTLLPQPPGEAGEFRPAGMWTRKSVGSNDCAILVRFGGQLTPQSQRGQQYTPQGEFMGQSEVKKVGLADVVRFPAGTQAVAMRVDTAAGGPWGGPWEPVAVFDGTRTRVLVEGTQVQCTHLRHDADGKCLDVSHNVDRGQYALRMMARFKGVGRREVGLHSEVLGDRQTQGYVFLDPNEPDLRAGDIAEFVLERTPWVSGEIHGIALAPRQGTTLRPPSFGPAIERELGGWPSLDCTVLDLDQGRLLVVPTNTVAASMNNPRPMLNWMVQQGADLTVTVGAGAGLHLDDGVLLRLAGGATFETVDVSTVRGQLAGRGMAQNVSIPDAEVKTQPVFVYRTREGGMGVLQVLGLSQNPRNLKIRFKAALPLQ